MKTVLTLVCLCFCLAALKADDERVFIDAKINGKPVRFAFDTGTGTAFLLTSAAAQQLGLKVKLPPTNVQVSPGQTLIGWTTPQKLDFGFTNIEARFAVVDLPSYLKLNAIGTLGWPAIKHNVFSLNCVAHTLAAFTNDTKSLEGWVQCPIETNSDLTLQLPDGNHSKQIITLDSGSIYGVKLNPQRWQQWKAAHTNQPITLEAYFTPGAGLVVAEESWADQISVGPLTLTGVPVMQADSSDIALHSAPGLEYVATLSLAAMKRLDIIIDGNRETACLRPSKTPPVSYEHNRLGAVFVPANLQGNDLIAHVIHGSPAFEAGIRDGDVLLKIDDLDCSRWRTDPAVLPLSRFFNRPAGTQLQLTLKRAGQILKMAAVLRNILPPDPAKN